MKQSKFDLFLMSYFQHLSRLFRIVLFYQNGTSRSTAQKILCKNENKSNPNSEFSFFREYLICQHFSMKTRMNADVLRVFDLSVIHFIF